MVISQRKILPFFIKVVVFHHVGISWIIKMEEQYDFSVDEYYEEFFTGGPCFNETIWQSLRSPLFEELFATERQVIYDIICVLHAYDKRTYNSTGAIYFHGGRLQP